MINNVDTTIYSVALDKRKLVDEQFKPDIATITGVLGCFSDVSVYIPLFHSLSYNINDYLPRMRLLTILSY